MLCALSCVSIVGHQKGVLGVVLLFVGVWQSDACCHTRFVVCCVGAAQRGELVWIAVRVCALHSLGIFLPAAVAVFWLVRFMWCACTWGWTPSRIAAALRVPVLSASALSIKRCGTECMCLRGCARNMAAAAAVVLWLLFLLQLPWQQNLHAAVSAALVQVVACGYDTASTEVLE